MNWLSPTKNSKEKNEKLENVNDQLKSTIEDLRSKNEFIDVQAKAFVACGTKKQLRKNNILKSLSTKLSKNYKEYVQASGTVLNFYESTSLSCGEGEIFAVLPERDKSSYQLEGAKLIITDTKKFWSTDKVVVLVKK